MFKESVFSFSALHSQQYKGPFIDNMISPELGSHVDNRGVPEPIQLIHSLLEIVSDVTLDQESENTLSMAEQNSLDQLLVQDQEVDNGIANLEHAQPKDVAS